MLSVGSYTILPPLEQGSKQPQMFRSSLSTRVSFVFNLPTRHRADVSQFY